MNEKELKKGEIIIYQSKGVPTIEVRLEEETIWLTQNQIALLFDVKKAAISKHIKNIIKSGELEEKSTVSKMETVQTEGGRKIKRVLTYFNLDMIISVGYRVNSKRATQFRIWATKTLKDHLVKGYTINEKRLLEANNKIKELQETITFLSEKSKHELLSGQQQEILNILEIYSKTIHLLEQYDSDKVKLAGKSKDKFVLQYDEAKKIIEQIKSKLIANKEATNLFGKEIDEKLKGIIGNIYQTFDKKELYASLEEKAANLLYLIIKDHPFIDGNKRIASFLFVYYLDKNSFLYRSSGEKKINDNGLTTLTLLIAISKPEEKEKFIKIITNLLAE